MVKIRPFSGRTCPFLRYAIDVTPQEWPNYQAGERDDSSQAVVGKRCRLRRELNTLQAMANDLGFEINLDAIRGETGNAVLEGVGSREVGMSYRVQITIEPGKRGGKPCIRGMRITVYDVLEYLASGMSEQEVLDDFPDLTRDDIRACLSFAADRE